MLHGLAGLGEGHEAVLCEFDADHTAIVIEYRLGTEGTGGRWVLFSVYVGEDESLFGDLVIGHCVCLLSRVVLCNEGGSALAPCCNA